MKVRIYTLGCKVNQFESQAMLDQLTDKGYRQAQEGENADVTIINSCAVTAAGEQKAVKLMNRIRREDPATVLVLTGCMAQTQPEGSSRFAPVDIILGNKRRSDLLPALEQYFTTHERVTHVEAYHAKDAYELLTVDHYSERTRAFLKIEDGCNRFCSYCIIPYARGRVRSCDLAYIDSSVKAFAANGYQEIVLVGINLSSFGSDNGLSFADAVVTACQAADVRIRLGSLEPESMDRETLKRLAECSNFCPQFHLSLQSGCDATLARMNRHYRSEDYAGIVENIRDIFDNPAITTDVMVGFAGETEEEFQQSLEFVRRIGFAKVHIFPYSRRPGTRADKAPGQLSAQVKKLRAKAMAEAAEEGSRSFLQSQLGRTEPVLIETRNRSGMYEGYTPNYTPVLVPADDSFVNRIVNVTLTDIQGDVMIGAIL